VFTAAQVGHDRSRINIPARVGSVGAPLLFDEAKDD